MGAAPEQQPVELLRRLIRFDTTNPPGGERECLAWAAGLLEDLGCDVRMLAREADRPNLIARISGRGACPPLLLQGHVDVVAAPGRWRHPPFAGELCDGYVWGRGALDMKGGVAMMLAAFMRAQAAINSGGAPPPGDVVLCLMADEEAGSDLGAAFLVDEHPELFEGVRHAIGEFGGFTMQLAGRRFYPIMVAEKQVCWTRATLSGPSGHGSLPVSGGAMAKLGRLLERLERRRLPAHVTPVARAMVESIAADAPAAIGAALRAMLVPALTDRVLDAIGERGRPFDPILHNTVSATIVEAGAKVNVIPGEASVKLDCRLLPGFGPEQLFAELRSLTGVEMELEVIRHDPTLPSADMGLFDVLGGSLKELDPEARPVPLLLPGATDGRFFARLGIQTYGFLPMQLPPELSFMSLIHSEDERLPAASLEFGTQAIARVLERFDV
jgi:acetylornithine deacetylase/succinyl-diaminopimelate desuccinylase-like protein